MPNTYVNKVNLADGTTILDISDTTATADKILQGYGAYGADGAWIDGTAIAGAGSAITITDTTDASGGTIRTITGVSLAGDTVTAAHLETGYTAHDALGNAITGQLSPGGQPNLQAKTNLDPTESSQTIEADSGYDGLSSVQINAVSSSFVGSGITRRSSTDLSASGATVTVPAGYYSAQATKSVSSMTLPTSASSSATSGYTSKATISRSTSDQYINIPTGYNSAGAYYKVNAVANGSVTAPSSISGTSASVSTGTNTLTLSKTVSVTPNVSTAGYISSGTAGNSSVSLTASVTTKAAATYHPSTSDQTISSGTYTTGTQTIKAVAHNLTADKIAEGFVAKIGDSTDDDCVASVTGTYSGGGGSSKAIYMYTGLASRKANSYGATDAQVTVTKAGTYNVSFVAIRGSSSGTMGTNLHIGSTAKGDNTTWNNGTYGQYVSYTNQSISANTTVTIYATSGSTSRSIYVGQLIVEEV